MATVSWPFVMLKILTVQTRLWQKRQGHLWVLAKLLQARQLQEKDGGFILVKDCVCPVMQHWRALGLWGLDWRRGVVWGAQRMEVGLGLELRRLGAGRMLHSGRCLALKSHLAVTRSPSPEAGWRTGGRGWWDGWGSDYGVTWLASWTSWKPVPHMPYSCSALWQERCSWMPWKSG